MRIPIGLALAALATLSLAGCSPSDFVAEVLHLPTTVSTVITRVTDATVPAKTVIIGANAFDAVEATAKNIIVICTPRVRPSACSDTAINKLIAAVRAGRNARDGLEGFLAAHPGALGSKGLYDALTATTATITQAIATYQANGG
jgi:hypothetical protein